MVDDVKPSDVCQVNGTVKCVIFQTEKQFDKLLEETCRCTFFFRPSIILCTSSCQESCQLSQLKYWDGPPLILCVFRTPGSLHKTCKYSFQEQFHNVSGSYYNFVPPHKLINKPTMLEYKISHKREIIEIKIQRIVRNNARWILKEPIQGYSW